MDLALTDEQTELVASFANLLAKSSTPEVVRSSEPVGFDEPLWRTLVETGAVPMAVDEGHGGWGASLLDLALVAEEIGAATAPAPVIETQVAARLLAAAGADEPLAAALAGERLVTLAVRGPNDEHAELVPAGAVCGDVIVFDGDVLRMVPITADDRQFVENLAAAPLADLRLSEGVVLADGPRAVELFEAALDEWLVLVASALVGIGDAAVRLACEYAIERKAFGTRIGSFQAIAHPLADDVTHLDGARLLVRKAAWSLDDDRPRGRELAAMAFAFASTTAEQSTYDALHTLGGYGFMLEYDVQLHHRRARGWPRVWGDADAAYRRAALARYGTIGAS